MKCSHTKLKYNKKNNLFECPCGCLSTTITKPILSDYTYKKYKDGRIFISYVYDITADNGLIYKFKKHSMK